MCNQNYCTITIQSFPDASPRSFSIFLYQYNTNLCSPQIADHVLTLQALVVHPSFNFQTILIALEQVPKRIIFFSSILIFQYNPGSLKLFYKMLIMVSIQLPTITSIIFLIQFFFKCTKCKQGVCMHHATLARTATEIEESKYISKTRRFLLNANIDDICEF